LGKVLVVGLEVVNQNHAVKLNWYIQCKQSLC